MNNPSPRCREALPGRRGGPSSPASATTRCPQQTRKVTTASVFKSRRFFQTHQNYPEFFYLVFIGLPSQQRVTSARIQDSDSEVTDSPAWYVTGELAAPLSLLWLFAPAQHSHWGSVFQSKQPQESLHASAVLERAKVTALKVTQLRNDLHLGPRRPVCCPSSQLLGSSPSSTTVPRL